MVVADLRSRSLRRLDFRFLLGDASCSRVGVDAVRDLEEALAELDLQPTPLTGASGPHDLVVLSNPDFRTIRRARRRTNPGGAVYIEATRSRPGGVQRLRRRMRRAGFVDVEMYWLWPSFRRSQPLFWLGLDGSAADHHLSRRGGGSMSRRCQDALWRLARRLGFLAPLAAVGWKAPVEGQSRSLLTYLAAASPALLGNGRASDLSITILTGGQSSTNKVVHLVSHRDQPAPAIAVKVARVPAAEIGLRREALALGQLDLRGIVRAPTLISAETLGAHFLVAETVEDGSPFISLPVSQVDAAAMRVVAGLADLATDIARAQHTEWWDRLVVPTIERFCTTFGVAQDGQEMVALASALSRTSGLPIVPEHRDCSPWNVFANDAGFVLMDWESAEPAGLPVLDALYFLANVEFVKAGTLGSGREDTTYASAIADGQDSLLRRGLAAYVDVLGLNPLELASLRAFAWMVHAPVEFDRLRLTGGLERDQAVAQSVTFRLWRIEADALVETLRSRLDIETAPG